MSKRKKETGLRLEADAAERESRGEFLFEGAGDVLLDLRQKSGLSLADVGERLGVAASTVMRYEKDDIALSDYAVARFAEVYDVDAQGLMLECMKRVLPGMADSPFGKLVNRVIQSNTSPVT